MTTTDPWRRRRILLTVAYLVAFVSTTVAWGFPASRDRVVIWALAALLIVVVGRPHGLAKLALDFLPVVAFLYAYDLLRGTADGLLGHVFTEPQLRADEWLFGGTAPSVTLQHALWTHNHPQVWDYASILVYLTYFLLPFTIAAILWRYRHALFHRYVTVWIGLSFAALVTYAVFPATPPWLASRQGFLPHVARIVPYLSGKAGFNLTRVMGSKHYVNKVAAVPSLHAATTLLISLFFWSRAKRWRWLLVLYPLAMAFALVYLGEHYVSDILLGWIYAVVIFVVGNRVYDRRTFRRAARKAGVAAAPPAGSPALEVPQLVDRHAAHGADPPVVPADEGLRLRHE
jgi:membrane-associated phospholipid phosphatase